MIPLRDDIMSVGAVCFPEYLKQRKTPGNEFLTDTLRSIPAAWRRMQGAVAQQLAVDIDFLFPTRRRAHVHASGLRVTPATPTKTAK